MILHTINSQISTSTISPRATQGHHPSKRGSAVTLSQANLFELYLLGACRLVVGWQAARAEKQSKQALSAACKGEELEEVV